MPFLSYFINPKGLKEYTPEEFAKKITEPGSIVIDVRTAMEYNHKHIQSASHVPLGTIKHELSSMNKNDRIFLVCATGHRSRAAATILIKNGFNDVSHLSGGMTAWKKYSGPKE
jgi:rhodanese-related sulfurtransferase